MPLIGSYISLQEVTSSVMLLLDVPTIWVHKTLIHQFMTRLYNKVDREKYLFSYLFST